MHHCSVVCLFSLAALSIFPVYHMLFSFTVRYMGLELVIKEILSYDLRTLPLRASLRVLLIFQVSKCEVFLLYLAYLWTSFYMLSSLHSVSYFSSYLLPHCLFSCVCNLLHGFWVAFFISASLRSVSVQICLVSFDSLLIFHHLFSLFFLVLKIINPFILYAVNLCWLCTSASVLCFFLSPSPGGLCVSCV